MVMARSTFAEPLRCGRIGTKAYAMDHTDVLRRDTVILVGASPVTIKPALANLPVIAPACRWWGVCFVALGRVPDVVIGDMDCDTRCCHRRSRPSISGQDDTDFSTSGPHRCADHRSGFLEARLDHSLAAIHALMGLRHDRPVLLAGGGCPVTPHRGY